MTVWEIDQRHVPPISEAIRGSGGIELGYVSTKENKVSTLRGPAQLADLQGALCVPTYNLTNGVVGRTMGFWVVGSDHTSTIINFFRLSHVELEKYPPRYTQEMKRLG